MGRQSQGGFLIALLVAACMPWLPGCTGQAPSGKGRTAVLTGSAAERDCLVRAMYFESNRSSHDDLMAVGTVVMNRGASPRYPNTICGVVGQHRQFAPGVMTRSLDRTQLSAPERAADAILKGERYAPVGDAMQFHVAGLKIPYRVQYVTVAGGNAFYLKKGRRFRDRIADKPTVDVANAPAPSQAEQAALAEATPKPTVVQRIFGGALAAPAGTQTAKSCDMVASAFGATSLACETELEGR
ncbi:MAG: cell wall hydrolase [Methyloceanibacter sp.]